MTLRADDGTPLETKEGAILDKEGNTLLEMRVVSVGDDSCDDDPYSTNPGGVFQKLKVFKLSPWMIPFIAAGLVIAFALGTVILGGVLSLLVSLWLLRSIFRALGLIS